MVNIISTFNSQHLAKNLQKNKKFRIYYITKNKDNKRFFPDGEIYTRLPFINKLRGKTVILHSGLPDPANSLVELKMVLEILKVVEINDIEILFSYFPFCM